MWGELNYTSEAGIQSIPLDKGQPMVLAIDPVGGLGLFEGPASQNRVPVLQIRWDSTRFHFLLEAVDSPSGPSVYLNETALRADKPYAVTRSSELRVQGQAVEIRIEYDPPFCQGRPMEELPLDRIGILVFGRGDVDSGEPGAIRVCLDGEARRISTKHTVLEIGAERFVLRDVSRYGTYLNGERFKEQKLVYGDRFQVGEYVFEFLVDKIRRVDHEPGGEINARGVAKVVTVRDRETGKRKNLPILADVDLDISNGEFIGILGGSGQGKSTLMNCLCGIASATKGRVWINGMGIADRAALMAAGIGFVPQDDIVHRELTVVQAVSLSAKLKLKLPEFAVRDLVDSVLKKLGLEPHRDKKVGRLSGGQRKRVSIATELLARPRVLFLDEPSSGLDPATEFELMELLQSLAATGMTVVCTTHVLENAHLFDRLLWVQGGRVVFFGNHLQARDHFLGTAPGISDSSFPSAETSLLGVQKLASLVRIYKALHESAESGAEWERKFQESGFRQEPKPVTTRDRMPPARGGARRRVGFWDTIRHLLVRQGLVLKSDPLNIVFLMAQALVIGVLIGWVAPDPVMRGFLGMVATLWFGCSNGAQQIVSELPIFQRERVSGLGRNAYILSKVGFLTGLTGTQALILIVTMLASSHLFHEPPSFEGKAEKLDQVLKEKLFLVEQREFDSREEEMLLLGNFGEVKEAKVTRDGLVESTMIEDLYYQVPDPGKWKPGETIDTAVGESLRLPADLPAHKPGPFKALSTRPGRAESPFSPGSWKVFGPLEKDLWKPGTEVLCPMTGQAFVLPKRLPAWPDQSFRFRLVKLLVTFFQLEDPVLDSQRSSATDEMRRIGIDDIPAIRLAAAILWPTGLTLFAFAAISVVGVSLGLAISAQVHSPTQAVMWVPLILIPQILFGGFVVTYPDMGPTVRAFSYFVPSFAAQRVLDVSHVFGRLVPRTSNQSKLPVFLNGDRETVKWETPRGAQKKETYQVPELRNPSWQNLLVLPNRVGQREIEKRYELIYDQRGNLKRSQAFIDDSVPYREDIRFGYVQGVRFVHIGEAQRATIILLCWFVACYGLILKGLQSKERLS